MRRFAIGLALSSVCSLGAAVPARAQVEVRSTDGRVAVELPESFGPSELNDEAVLEYGSDAEQAFFVVIIEDSEDLYGWNLTRYSFVGFGSIVALADFPEVEGPFATEVGGHPAVQHELRGVTQGSRIVMLHTTIEHPSMYVQLLAWSAASAWDEAEIPLRRAIESLRFLEPKASMP